MTGGALFPAAYADTLRMGGSGTNLGAARLLAEAFLKSRPNDKAIILPSLGSSGGVKAVLAGAIDIALISRPLENAERGKGAVAIEYGRTPFVFATGKKSRSSALTVRRLAEIYSGKVTEWPDGSRIRLVLRPMGDSDTALQKSISPEMREAVEKALSRAGMNVAVTDLDSATAIERLPGALGTSTLGLILSGDRDLKPLSLDGVMPSVQAIADGIYPYYKRLFMITGPKKPPTLARQFIAFVRSAIGSEILTRTGHWVVQAKIRP